MERYGAEVRDLTAIHEAVFADTQAAFDGVLARAFLNAFGYACQ